MKLSKSTSKNQYHQTNEYSMQKTQGTEMRGLAFPVQTSTTLEQYMTIRSFALLLKPINNKESYISSMNITSPVEEGKRLKYNNI